ncbi:MAG: hypothetical protein NWE95_00130 [Candidatus Bathyarchaeota archaeon]|nr:hypothetical protein [Candidatus Bathyarchaeota archaeon]
MKLPFFNANSMLKISPLNRGIGSNGRASKLATVHTNVHAFTHTNNRQAHNQTATQTRRRHKKAIFNTDVVHNKPPLNNN